MSKRPFISLALGLLMSTSIGFSRNLNPSYCSNVTRSTWDESSARATFYDIPKDCQKVWCAFVLDDSWSNFSEVPIVFTPGDTVVTTTRIVPSGSYFNPSPSIWPGGKASVNKPGFVALCLWSPANTDLKNQDCTVQLSPSNIGFTPTYCKNFRAYVTADKKSIVMTGLNNHSPNNWFAYSEGEWASYIDLSPYFTKGKDTAFVDMTTLTYSLGAKQGMAVELPLSGQLIMMADWQGLNQCTADNQGGNNKAGINLAACPIWNGEGQQPPVVTPNPIPGSGLIGYWPFNGNANDESGHGHNGIVANAKLTTDKDNKVNSAYSFSGNGTITVPYHKDFDFSKIKQYSYGCWIYNTTSGNQVYMGKDAPGCQNISFNIQQESTGIFTTGMHGSSCWNTYTSNKSLGVNQWHHVLVSVDSMSLSIYIDGKFINKNQMVNPMWGDYVSSIVFGAWPSYHGNERFVRGKIDDVVLYNRAITASEVTALYQHGICDKPLTIQDTTVFKICDAKFQAISPKLYFVGTDSVKSKYGCDSIINRYIKYQYSTDCCPNAPLSIESLTIKATTPAGTVTINVYPNPTKDHVRVECVDYAKIENYQVKLISASSMILWSAVINQSSFDIDMTTIPQGVYMIEVYDNKGNRVDYKKIIKL